MKDEGQDKEGISWIPLKQHWLQWRKKHCEEERCSGHTWTDVQVCAANMCIVVGV